jgi:hypothetical protein
MKKQQETWIKVLSKSKCVGFPDTFTDQPTLYYGVPEVGRAGSKFGQQTTIKSGFVIKSHRLVKPLACPARFERATYALEAGKMS